MTRPTGGSSDEIVALAKRTGLPVNVVSTWRPGAVTASGSPSWHASDNAVDFGGYSQDALARYFMGIPTLEVIHHSNKTGANYAMSDGRPFALRGALLDQHRNHLHVAAREATLRGILGGSTDPVGAPFEAFRAGLKATGSPLADVISWFPNPATTREALTNIGSGVAVAAEGVQNVGVFAKLLTRAFMPSNLLRGALFLFGAVFVLLGIWFLSMEVRDS